MDGPFKSETLPLPNQSCTPQSLWDRGSSRTCHRKILAISILFPIVLLVTLFRRWDSRPYLFAFSPDLGSPDWKILPLYGRFYEEEMALPQHNAYLPTPEGRDGRYLWVSGQVTGKLWLLYGKPFH